MTLKISCLALAMAISLGACSSGSNSNNNNTNNTGTTTPPATPTTPGVTPPNFSNTPSDVRTATASVASTSTTNVHEVVVPVQAGDASFILNVYDSANRTGAEFFVAQITAPDGTVLYRSDENGNVSVSTYSDDSIGGAELGSFIFPNSTRLNLQTGDYRVRIAVSRNADRLTAGIIYKTGTISANTRYLLDFNVVVATNDANMRSQTYIDNLRTNITSEMDKVLMQQNMRIGTMNIQVASTELTSRIGTVMADASGGGALGNVCTELNTLFGTGRAVNLAFLNLTSSSGDLAGVSTGLPGSIFNSNNNRSCVLAGISAFPANDFAQHAANWLHEAGHFMGLPHTTEEEGTSFDDFNDTPQCLQSEADGRTNTEFTPNTPGQVDRRVSALECGILGGANNLMFWEGVEEYSDSFQLTPEQAFVLRHHPYTRVSP